jgi:hypothetical protein
MVAVHRTATGDLVSLCNEIIHVDVWKNIAILPADGRKLLWAVDRGILLRESKGSSVRVGHL